MLNQTYYFPIDQQQELADGLSKAKKNIKVEKITIIQGHDSFLVDEKRFSKVIYEFFLIINDLLYLGI